MAFISKKIKKTINQWYLLILIGLLFIVLGSYIFIQPLVSFLTLASLVSITIMITGLLECVYAFMNRSNIDNWGWSLCQGLLNIIIGCFLYKRPDITADIFNFFIGFFILFRGIMGISYAIDLSNYKFSGWIWSLLLSILTLIMGIVLLINPVLTNTLLMYYIGVSFVFFGLFNCLIGITLKRLKNRATY